MKTVKRQKYFNPEIIGFQAKKIVPNSLNLTGTIDDHNSQEPSTLSLHENKKSANSPPKFQMVAK